MRKTNEFHHHFFKPCKMNDDVSSCRSVIRSKMLMRKREPDANIIAKQNNQLVFSKHRKTETKYSKVTQEEHDKKERTMFT